ncbi:DMT family transporter [Candidatus Aenigmatarchaeota archaeon]
MDKQKLGIIFAICTALVSGFSIPLNKIFVTGLEPVVFTAVRAIIAGTVFLIIVSYQSKFDYKQFKKVPWKYLLAIAIIGGSFAFLLFYSGLQLTTGGRAAFLHKTLPIYVAIFAFFFLKEKISKKYVFALGVMFIGMIAIYSTTINPTELWSNPQLGDLLVIGGTILWALENVISRRTMVKGESNFVVSFARMFFGGVILFGVIVLWGKIDVLFALQTEQIINIFISAGLLFGYVFFWYWSIKLINVSKAAPFLLIAPVISAFLGILFFAEPFPPLQIIGSILILMGAFFVIRMKND